MKKTDVEEIIKETLIVGHIDMPLTESVFLEALYELNNRMGVVKDVFCILSPVQVEQLLGKYLGASIASTGTTSKLGVEIGAFASFYGVDIVKSNKCPLISDETGYQGLMASLGGIAFNKVLIISKSEKVLEV